jgi:hypothetical protein
VGGAASWRGAPIARSGGAAATRGVVAVAVSVVVLKVVVVGHIGFLLVLVAESRLFEVADGLCMPIKRPVVIADSCEHALGACLCRVKGRLQVKELGRNIFDVRLQLL